MLFDLVETILVREMKLEDRRRYVAGRLYNNFILALDTETLESSARQEATESRAACHAASLNDTQSLS